MTKACPGPLPMLFLLAVALAACASPGDRPAGGTRSTLSQEEMASISGSNLYEVVERLRPRWLQVRGPMSLSPTSAPQIVVFMNSSYLGGPAELRQFNPRDVKEVRWLDGPTATATLRGYDARAHVAGAIVLVTVDRDP